MKTTKKVARNAYCPCGSRKKYKHCCINKGFNWVTDEEENVCKSIKIDDEDFSAILKTQYERFQRIFGRDPQPEDPIWFDRYVISDDAVNEEIIREFMKANIPPVLIYAYQKTGRIVTDKNKSFLTKIELAEWNAAIEEYYMNENNIEENELDYFQQILQNLAYEWEASIYIFGMLIDKCGTVSNGEKYTIRDFIFYCIAKTQKSLNSLFTQIVSRSAEECICYFAIHI